MQMNIVIVVVLSIAVAVASGISYRMARAAKVAREAEHEAALECQRLRADLNAARHRLTQRAQHHEELGRLVREVISQI